MVLTKKLKNVQITQETALPADPSKDVNFKEDRIDKLRAQKDDELDRQGNLLVQNFTTRWCMVISQLI